MRAGLTVLTLSAPGLTGCHPFAPALVPHAEEVPAMARGRHVADPAGPSQIAVGAGGSIAWADHRDPAGNLDVTQLQLIDGRVTGTGYAASEVVLSSYRNRYPWGEVYLDEIARCVGTVTFEEGAWTIALDEGPCSARNGVYRAPAPEPADENETVTAELPASIGECRRYRDCACALAGFDTSGPFALACTDAERLLTSAPDDPASCEAGRSLLRSTADGLDRAIPVACQDP